MNLNELMMNMTGGIGCAENEHFSFYRYSEKAFCCPDDSEDDGILRLAPNVCRERPKRMEKGTPEPSCRCNKGFDLKFRNINTIYGRYMDVQPR